MLNIELQIFFILELREVCFAFLLYFTGQLDILLETISVLVYKPPLFDLKIVYPYVIEVADSESDLGLHGKALVSEIHVFAR